MKLPDRFTEPRSPLFWLALLRIMLGLVFLTTWINNWNEGIYTPDGLLRFFTHSFPQSENPLTFYAAFINGVILPIRAVFAPFQMVTEFLMGLALLLGFATRPFSLIAIFFLFNTLLATAGHDWPWAYLMPIGILAVLFLARAGRAIGLDARMLRKFGARWGWLG